MVALLPAAAKQSVAQYCALHRLSLLCLCRLSSSIYNVLPL